MSTQPLQNVNPSETANATGASGKTYNFFVHPIGTSYKPIAGVYIFCRPDGNGGRQAVYVGETDNLARRLSYELTAHHAWNSIRGTGATEICTLVVTGGKQARVNIETDLRHSLNPSCNRQ